MKNRSLIEYFRNNRKSVAVYLLLSTIYFIAYFHRVGVPGTIFNELQSDFSMSAGAVTALGAIFLFIYGGIQIPVGMLTDKYGARRIFLAGGVLLTLGSFVFPASGNIPMLYAGRALIGFGAGFIYLSLMRAIDDLFSPEHFAVVLSILTFIGITGGLAGTLPFAKAAGAFGWRTPLFLIAALSAGLMLASHFTIKKMKCFDHPVKRTSLAGIRDVFRNRHTYPVALSASINFSIYFLVQGILGKKVLQDQCGVSSSAAAGSVFAMTLVAMLFSSSAGFILKFMGDRRKPVAIIATSATLLATALVLASAYLKLGAGWFLAGYLLLACSVMATPALVCVVKETNKKENAVTAVGLMNGSCYVMVALLSYIAGVIMDGFRESAVSVSGAVIYPTGAYTAIFSVCLAAAGGSSCHCLPYPGDKRTLPGNV